MSCQTEHSLFYQFFGLFKTKAWLFQAFSFFFFFLLLKKSFVVSLLFCLTIALTTLHLTFRIFHFFFSLFFLFKLDPCKNAIFVLFFDSSIWSIFLVAFVHLTATSSFSFLTCPSLFPYFSKNLCWLKIFGNIKSTFETHFETNKEEDEKILSALTKCDLILTLILWAFTHS